ncbi:MAG: hypothetical protein QOE84_3076 [Actinomycetota bacterium]|nr:hypothetical protein [Actinomycetota bacterium]
MSWARGERALGKTAAMSKVDAMRALKQARLEEQRRGAPAPPAVARRAVPAAAPAAKPVTAVAETSGSGACGHRNISGRECTRDSGHSEKSHRYS